MSDTIIRPVTICDRKRLVIRVPCGDVIEIEATTEDGLLVPRVIVPVGTTLGYKPLTSAETTV